MNNDNCLIPKTKLSHKLKMKLKNLVHTFIKYLMIILTVLEKLKNIFDF